MTNLAPIQWVVFDAVGTLIFADPPVHMAYHRIGRKYGCSITPPVASQRFRDAMAAEAKNLETSAERELQFWKSLVARILPDSSHPEATFQGLWEHFAAPASWGLYADVEETLSALRDRGIQVAIASNFDQRLHSVMNGHADLKPITRRFISSEVGWKKPSPNFFNAIQHSLGVPASSILMIGDSLADDITPARSAGFQALHLDRTSTDSPGALTCLTELMERLPGNA